MTFVENILIATTEPIQTEVMAENLSQWLYEYMMQHGLECQTEYYYSSNQVITGGLIAKGNGFIVLAKLHSLFDRPRFRLELRCRLIDCHREVVDLKFKGVSKLEMWKLTIFRPNNQNKNWPKDKSRQDYSYASLDDALRYIKRLKKF